MTVAYTDFFAKVKEVLDGFISTKYNQFAAYAFYYVWDKQNNFLEFELEYYHLIAIMDSISAFLIDVSRNYFDYIIEIEIALFVYNLVFVTFIFAFAWRKFLEKMGKSITETANLLSLMPIEALVVNPYVMSFINAEKSRLRVS